MYSISPLIVILLTLKNQDFSLKKNFISSQFFMWWYRIQFNRSVMSNSLQLHRLQHARLPSPSLPELAQTHVHRVDDNIQQSLCRSLLLLPSILPRIRVFSDESVLPIRWPKYWSFSFSISPSNEYSGLISFSIDCFDLLAVQATLKSLLQHHSSKASILWHSAFFIVQLLHPYVTTGKTIALTRWTFVGKVMSLLFNMLSRLVIAFLPRSKHLLISWLQSLSAVILEPFFETLFFYKASHCFHCFPIFCHEVMGPDAMILVS